MTVVRRPARISHSCPVFTGTDFLSSSRATVLRAESTRQVIEEQFQSLVSESLARQMRFTQFGVACRDLTEFDRQELKRQFVAEETHISRCCRNRLRADRFHQLSLLGRGGFGEVWLVQDRLTYELCALKILSKADVISREQIACVRTERDILRLANNPWVVQLKASFQDCENLYFVLEYCPGGDLMGALEKYGFFTEPMARFFTGELALALRSIHELNVVHRDLKPDNVLMSESGHIKLADFGLSAGRDNRMRSVLQEVQHLISGSHIGGDENLVGTEYYIAPEVFEGTVGTAASDYWSLGVILYEMLCGTLPFVGKSQQETVLRIKHWRTSLRLPKSLSPNARDLLRHLLCGPAERYGFEQIVCHPFFSGFDFENVMINVPPLVPVLSHPADTTHFTKVAGSRRRGGQISPNEELASVAFIGFTYKQRPRNMTLARLGIFDLA
jgi:serine/threonine protein kinase